MVSARKLLKLKEETKKADVEKNKLKGRLESLLSQREEAGCKTTKSAKKYIREREKTRDIKKNALTKKLKALDRDYDWNG